MRIRSISLTVLFCLLSVLFLREARAEFEGKAPTGLFVLEKNHPYYLYVPPDYSAEKSWGFLILVGQKEKDPEAVVNPWIEWAKQNHFLIMVPSVFPRDGSVPELVDKWILGVKSETGERYRIDRSQTLLMGIGSGAHYAAYMGLNYPKEFSGAILVRGAWAGTFEKLMKPQSNPNEQIPFFVALDQKDKGFAKQREWTLKLEKKGYQITVVNLDLGEAFSKVQERILAWHEQRIAPKPLVTKAPRKTFKQKWHGVVKDFFEV